VAEDFLRAVVVILLAWAWHKIEVTAPSAAEPSRWTVPASALRHWVLPEFAMRVGIIKARLQ
jgi:hypothetical protein